MSWIASHFNRTLIIDLRAQPDNFSVNQFLRDYDIEIVLITYPYTDMYFNGNLFIPIEFE